MRVQVPEEGFLQIRAETAVLLQSQASAVGVRHRRDARGIRSAADLFVLGIASGMGQDGKKFVNNLIACTRDVCGLVIGLYEAVTKNGLDTSVVDVFNVAATWLSAIKRCVETVGGVVPNVFKRILGVIDKVTSCFNFVRSIVRGEWFNAGEYMYTCLKILKLRRSLSPQPPPSWTCEPSSYNHSRYCHVGCGAYDPDCDDALLPVLVHDYHQTPAPLTWQCFPGMYDDKRTCDQGCGTVDPDCSNTRLPVHAWKAGLTFAVDLERRGIFLAAGTPQNGNSEPNQNGNSEPNQNGNSEPNTNHHATVAALATVAAVMTVLCAVLGAALWKDKQLRAAATAPAHGQPGAYFLLTDSSS